MARRSMDPTPCMSCGGAKDRRPPRGCLDAKAHGVWLAQQIEKARRTVAQQDEAAAKAERE